MGEIADMSIDGTFCAECGCYLKGEAEGFPRYCSDCGKERSYLERSGKSKKRRRRKKAFKE